MVCSSQSSRTGKSNGGSVTTITVGTTADDPTIRKALAIGANDAVRIDTEASDAYFVAKQIAEYLNIEGSGAYVRVSQLKKQAVDRLIENVDHSQVFDIL